MNENEKNETNIRFLLHEHPLYDTADPNANQPWRIVVVGFTQAAQIFIQQALCLAVTHFGGADLRILCTGAQNEEATVFLKKRPELRRFFTVNGKPAKLRPPYGKIDLLSGARITALLAKALTEKTADYVYISTGSEQTTQNLAALCFRYSPAAFVAADCRNLKDGTQLRGKHFAVFPAAQEPSPKCMEYIRQTEQMARNLHWLWASPTDTYSKTEKMYMKDGNRNSSVSSVCSLQYKLYCIFQNDMRNLSAGDAADLFCKYLSDEETGALNLEKISWAEHRRWCTEKILLGYSQWNDFEKAAELHTTHIETEKNKYHLSLRERRSDTEMELSGGNVKKLRDFDPKKYDWNELNPDDFPDEIDKMSLKYHAAYQKLLKNARGTEKRDFLPVYQDIYQQIAHIPQAVIAYHNWRFSIQQILKSGDPNAIRLYRDATNELRPHVVEGQLNRIDLNVQTAIRSFQHTDYHYIDTQFSRNIPYILTYSHEITLFIPVSPESCDITDPTQIFHNIAAVYALEPSKAHFLIHVNGKAEWKSVLQFLRHITGFFAYKEYRTAFTAHIFCPARTVRKSEDLNGTENFLICTHRADTFPEAVQAAKILLKRQKLYAVQYRRNCALSGALAAEASVIPHFIFDSAAQKFSAMPTEPKPESVRMFDHIRSESLRPLLVSDIGMLSGAATKPATQPRFDLYTDELIAYYESHIDQWKQCCNLLRSSCERRIKFPKPGGKNITYTENMASDAKLNLIGLDSAFYSMQQMNLLRNYKRYSNENGDFIFEMEIPDDFRSTIHQIFQLIRNLDDGTAEYSVFHEQQNRFFSINTLSDSFSLKYKKQTDARGTDSQAEYRMLSYFLDKMKQFGFVKSTAYAPLTLKETADGAENETEIGKIIRIVYRDRESKALLTSAGRMLEIYLYTHLFPIFSDIQTSVEIVWDPDRNLRNELDVIGVRGYQTFILEAKVQNSLTAETVYKCRSIAKSFGINPITMIVNQTDTLSGNLKRIGSVYHVDLIGAGRLTDLEQGILSKMDDQ